jgi:hypothetical protein
MPMTPIERKAAFAAAVVLNGTTRTAAARDAIGVSWQHLQLVLDEQREGSAEVRRRFAAYIGRPEEEVFPPRPLLAAAG